MPPSKAAAKPTAETPANAITHPAAQLSERRVRHMGAGYFAHSTDVEGKVVLVQQHALRGEAIMLTPIEESRLDCLNALAPPGATADDVADEIQKTEDAYKAARASVSGVGLGGGLG